MKIAISKQRALEEIARGGRKEFSFKGKIEFTCQCGNSIVIASICKENNKLYLTEVGKSGNLLRSPEIPCEVCNIKYSAEESGRGDLVIYSLDSEEQQKSGERGKRLLLD